ncbi:hypothetical protein D3C77_538730 [compost metagenome]
MPVQLLPQLVDFTLLHRYIELTRCQFAIGLPRAGLIPVDRRLYKLILHGFQRDVLLLQLRDLVLQLPFGGGAVVYDELLPFLDRLPFVHENLPNFPSGRVRQLRLIGRLQYTATFQLVGEPSARRRLRPYLRQGNRLQRIAE